MNQFDRDSVGELARALDTDLAELTEKISDFKEKVHDLLRDQHYGNVEYEQIVNLLRDHEEIDGVGGDTLMHKVHSDLYDIRTNLIHLFREYAEANATAK